MFFRLAVRNVKRQFGNYMIYFMTVVLIVALLFAVNNVLYSDAMQVIVGSTDLRPVLIWSVALIGLVVAFVLSYATSFMLKLRRREFGTYLTLGMRRGDILCIFLFETFLICVAALGAGLLLGLFLYQGLMVLVMNMMEMRFVPASYSAQGLKLTVVIVSGIFLTALAVSSLYLKKVTIYDLIHGEKKVEKSVRYPALWFFCMMAAAAVMAGCLASLSGQIGVLIRESRGSARTLISTVGLFAAALMVFHIALDKSVVFLLLRNRRFKEKRCNTFVLRQLSGALGSNAVMHGCLAFLLTFAVIGVNAAFIHKESQEEILDDTYPYDVMYCDDRFFNMNGPGANAIPLEECEARIEKYRPILDRIPYQLYTTDRSDLYGQTCWAGEGYEGLVDCFMPLSEFNALIEPLGYDEVELQEEYLIVSIDGRAWMTDWKDVTFTEEGKEYRFRGYTEEYPVFCRYYFYAVVPDEAVNSMRRAVAMTAYDLEDGEYDALLLKEELSYLEVSGYGERQTTWKRSDFFLREYGRQVDNGIGIILVTGALFAAMVFLLMALAVLALKMLSNLAEDRRRYEVLYLLGADEEEQGRALLGQTFFFFMMPFGSSMLMSIPVCLIGMEIVSAFHLERSAGSVPVTAAVTAAVMMALYLMYYAAAYLLARRVVVCNGSAFHCFPGCDW